VKLLLLPADNAVLHLHLAVYGVVLVVEHLLFVKLVSNHYLLQVAVLVNQTVAQVEMDI
jgi:hypothetical protein